ncbi:Agglutinin-like protein [Verticillium dahliae]
MRWYVFAIVVCASRLAESMPQYDLCAGYCSGGSNSPPVQEPEACSPRTVHITQTIRETRAVTTTKQVTITAYEPATEHITRTIVSTVYADEHASVSTTRSVQASGITSYPSTVTRSLCTPRPSYGLALDADLELINAGATMQEQQLDCVFYTTTVWKTTVVRVTPTPEPSTHARASSSTGTPTGRSTDLAESIAHTCTSAVPTVAPSITVCPAPTNAPGDYAQLPHDPTSNRTFGCIPLFVCDPPKPRGCDIWADSPNDDYVCDPKYCISSPPYARVHWAEGATGYVPLDQGYFNLNPHAFGLPYSVFVNEAIAGNPYGEPYTVPRDDRGSAADLDVSTGPLPLVARRVPSSRRGALSVKQRQDDGAPAAPAVCFDDCNNCYKEALAVGKSPSLCRAGSQFRQDYQQCIACIDANVENGPFIRVLYIDQKFDQFLRYCEGQEPVPVNSSSSADAPTSAIPTSTLLTDINASLPETTSTFTGSIDLTPTTASTATSTTISTPTSTILSSFQAGTTGFAQEPASSDSDQASSSSSSQANPPSFSQVNPTDPGHNAIETTTQLAQTSVDQDGPVFSGIPASTSTDEPILGATLSAVATAIGSGQPASSLGGSTIAQSRPTGNGFPIAPGDPAVSVEDNSVAPTGTGLSDMPSSTTGRSNVRSPTMEVSGARSPATRSSALPMPATGSSYPSPASARPSRAFEPGNDAASTRLRHTVDADEPPAAATPSLVVGSLADRHAPVSWMPASLLIAVFMHVMM